MIFLKPKFWDKNKITFFSILFFPISLLITLLNFFKFLIIKKHSFSIPIICVGNIYLGGTGKTPLSIEIFSILKNLKMKPAFIRKKYESYQDEVELQKKSGLIFQNKKRTLAIKEAIQNNVNIAILDDGFQDFSINKNLSILCFNENQWIGNGLVIPAGPLRESLSALKRANCVIINGKKNMAIENELLKKNNKIKIFYSQHEVQNIKELKNLKITAFAGIGNPSNFFNLLKFNKINVSNQISFPDHYKYSEEELAKLYNDASKNDNTLLTTEKDYFRIPQNYKKYVKFLKIKVVIENRTEFINEIKKII